MMLRDACNLVQAVQLDGRGGKGRNPDFREGDMCWGLEWATTKKSGGIQNPSVRSPGKDSIQIK